MALKKTKLRKITIPVKGTKRLVVGDPQYLADIANNAQRGCEKDLVFDGKITAADLGYLEVKEVNFKGHDDEYDIVHDFNQICITIYQADRESLLETYKSGRYYKDTDELRRQLGCDHAEFYIKTDFGEDYFSTLSDGCYGDITVYKPHFGMCLNLYITTDAITFDEAVERFKKIFPEREVALLGKIKVNNA